MVGVYSNDKSILRQCSTMIRRVAMNNRVAVVRPYFNCIKNQRVAQETKRFA